MNPMAWSVTDSVTSVFQAVTLLHQYFLQLLSMCFVMKCNKCLFIPKQSKNLRAARKDDCRAVSTCPEGLALVRGDTQFPGVDDLPCLNH